MKTVAYLRVSTRSQDLANQKLAILEFSQKRRFPIDQFIESRISSRKSPLERRRCVVVRAEMRYGMSERYACRLLGQPRRNARLLLNLKIS